MVSMEIVRLDKENSTQNNLDTLYTSTIHDHESSRCFRAREVVYAVSCESVSADHR